MSLSWKSIKKKITLKNVAKVAVAGAAVGVLGKKLSGIVNTVSAGAGNIRQIAKSIPREMKQAQAQAQAELATSYQTGAAVGTAQSWLQQNGKMLALAGGALVLVLVLMRRR